MATVDGGGGGGNKTTAYNDQPHIQSFYLQTILHTDTHAHFAVRHTHVYIYYNVTSLSFYVSSCVSHIHEIQANPQAQYVHCTYVRYARNDSVAQTVDYKTYHIYNSSVGGGNKKSSIATTKTPVIYSFIRRHTLNII